MEQAVWSFFVGLYYDMKWLSEEPDWEHQSGLDEDLPDSSVLFKTIGEGAGIQYH